MLSVTGIYDGNSIVFTEPVNHHKKCKVIVTFLEEDAEEEAMQLRNFGMQNDAFDFWNNPAEDVYEDYIKKKQ